jgi:hypothetical protein
MKKKKNENWIKQSFPKSLVIYELGRIVFITKIKIKIKINSPHILFDDI